MQIIAMQDFHMWMTFVLIVGAFVLFFLERASMELTSIGILCVLLVFFHFFPVIGEGGKNLLGPVRILLGFANPALLTVLALLVIGNGMVRTGVLDRGAGFILNFGGPYKSLLLSFALGLVIVMVVSAFLNNIPVVVIFIPIIQALATRYGKTASRYLMPLSFAAVLGGMTTLIGSSTNLLVNSALFDMGKTPFEFFDFTVPGIVMALSGLVYVVFIAPKLLPDRSPDAGDITTVGGHQFIAQLTISKDSLWVGMKAIGGLLPGLEDKTLRMVERGDEAFLPPFEDYVAQVGDVLVVAATRKVLTKTLTGDPASLHPEIKDGPSSSEHGVTKERWLEGEQVTAEAMVAPSSGFIGLTLSQIGLRYKTHCIVLGIQRRSRMFRSRLTDIRLQSGDVLLVQGQPDDISRLKHFRDLVLLEWSAEDLPNIIHAKRAALIFLGVIGFSATGIVPIVIAAISGAAAMVAVGVLNHRHALQSVDSRIIVTIAAALALGAALQVTGGAAFIANQFIIVMDGASPAVVLSVFFLLVAVLSNIISTKTSAVLFTPIAVDIAVSLGVPFEPFAVAVLFAANCSFASPLGYQTNLLVMGPGHYKFSDFARAGVPLIVLLWLTFTLFAPWYYGL